MKREERVLVRMEKLTMEAPDSAESYFDSETEGRGGKVYIKYPEPKNHEWMFKYVVFHDGTVRKWMPNREKFLPIRGKFAKIVAISVEFT